MSLSKLPKKRFCHPTSKIILIAFLLFMMMVPVSKTKMEEVVFQEEKIDYESLRGIYITANTAASKNLQLLANKLIESGGNFMVMDIEVSGGQLAFVPEDPFLTARNPGSTLLANLKSIIRDLHKKGIYVAARQVIFNDLYAGSRYPEWRIKYKGGGTYNYNWIDPSHPEVQAYNLAITREVAKLGFDEIQYDYIRFPDEWHTNLDYYYDETQKERWEVINDFLAKAHQITQEYDIKLGIDVFGATIWGDIDWDLVGQYIPEVAKNVDAIYPMTYPSHVNPGYYGFQNPYGDPGSFVKESIKKFVTAANGNAEIRTWIQGFPLKAPDFGDWYMQEQVRGTYDGGANDWVIWSPGNRYGHSWSSMRLMPPEPIEEGEPDPEPETEK